LDAIDEATQSCDPIDTLIVDGESRDLRGQIFRLSSILGPRELVSQMLEKVESNDDLIRFIHRYTVFNGNFAGGVIQLASAFHVRQDLFRDPMEPVAACADRSARIASHIFFAAEDEYSDRDDHSRITHRDLGQFLLKGAIEHFGYDPQTFDEKFPFNLTTRDVLDDVLRGYTVTGPKSDAALFRGLGFHIASELSADQEFKAINSYLLERNPGLVEHLMAAETHLGQACYRWVNMHTFVELEHLDHAIDAATMAIEYYAGDRTPTVLQDLIIEGFNDFSTVLRRFIGRVLDAA